jgi:hypothetical protein
MIWLLFILPLVRSSCLSVSGFSPKTGVYLYQKDGNITRKPINEVKKGDYILGYSNNSNNYEPIEISHIGITIFYGHLYNISFSPISNKNWNIEYIPQGNLKGSHQLDINNNPPLYNIYSVPTQQFIINRNLDIKHIGNLELNETLLFPDFQEGKMKENMIAKIGRVHVKSGSMYSIYLKKPKGNNERQSYLTDLGFALENDC